MIDCGRHARPKGYPNGHCDARLLRLSDAALSAEDSGQNEPLKIGQGVLFVLRRAHENRDDLTERHIDLSYCRRLL
jgi:hypothetical protein